MIFKALKYVAMGESKEYKNIKKSNFMAYCWKIWKNLSRRNFFWYLTRGLPFCDLDTREGHLCCLKFASKFKKKRESCVIHHFVIFWLVLSPNINLFFEWNHFSFFRALYASISSKFHETVKVLWYENCYVFSARSEYELGFRIQWHSGHSGPQSLAVWSKFQEIEKVWLMICHIFESAKSNHFLTFQNSPEIDQNSIKLKKRFGLLRKILVYLN